jgi:ubiquitin carboxyl-terminal hydrolase L3
MAEEEQKVVDAATSTEGTVKRRKWFPLESNPDVCNKYIKNLGWPTEMYEFYELMSTEDWAIGMVPGPIMAILLLFPISERSEAAKQAQEEEIKANGQQVPEDTFFLKQTIGNACGTIGLIHALTNAAKSHQVPIEQDKFLHRFATLTATMTP